jgi:hypothetical protein
MQSPLTLLLLITLSLTSAIPIPAKSSGTGEATYYDPGLGMHRSSPSPFLLH